MLRAMTLPERIVALETKVSDHTQALSDVEHRLRAVERSIYLATGFLTALQLAIKYAL